MRDREREATCTSASGLLPRCASGTTLRKARLLIETTTISRDGSACSRGEAYTNAGHRWRTATLVTGTAAGTLAVLLYLTATR